MTPMPESHQDLERLIHRTLRDLPARRAPGSIEQRVLAEIARRAALPCGGRSLRTGRCRPAGFFLLCLGLVILALMGGVWIMAGFDSAQFKEAFAQPFSAVERVLVVAFAPSLDSSTSCSGTFPPLWLYGTLVLFASMYAALFGLGAAAYKALLVHR
jgi:hypothetical protein